MLLMMTAARKMEKKIPFFPHPGIMATIRRTGFSRRRLIPQDGGQQCLGIVYNQSNFCWTWWRRQSRTVGNFHWNLHQGKFFSKFKNLNFCQKLKKFEFEFLSKIWKFEFEFLSKI